MQQQQFGGAFFPRPALGELEEHVQQRRQAGVLRRIHVHGALKFAGDVAEFDDRNAFRQRLGQPAKRHAAAAPGPGHDALEIGPDIAKGGRAGGGENPLQFTRPAGPARRVGPVRQARAAGQPPVVHRLQQRFGLRANQVQQADQSG